MSGPVVKASDILGRELGARAANDAAEAAAAALDFDLGLLLVNDPHKTAEDNAALLVADGTSEESMAHAQRRMVRQVTRALVARLWDLPLKTRADDETAKKGAVDEDEEEIGMAVARLPAPVLRLPREKPVPEAPEDKVKTRWEKFAERKGIQKRKRSRLVWDEVEKDWVPRFGLGSKKKLAKERDDWVIEAKDQDVVVQIGSRKNKKLRAKLRTPKGGAGAAAAAEDPFDARDKDRAKLKKKQVVNQVRNMRRARKEKVGGLGVLDDDVKPAKLEASRAGKRKTRLETALNAARISTASLGKFDREVHVEGTKMPQLKRRKVLPDREKEKETNKRLLNKIVGDI